MGIAKKQLVSVLAVVALTCPLAVRAQPSGGSVVFGAATIAAPNSSTTLINQTTNAAIINWQNFSLASGSSVVFDQPSAASIMLNRVVGGGSSLINGNLLANGQVWIINSNGILFGKDSQINVGGLLATTSDIADSDFAAGRYNANIVSPNASAAVDNAGTIHVANGGSAILSGSHVSNEGLIEATGGQIVLSGASAFTVDFDGDNLLRYAITAPVTTTPTDADGRARAEIVSNSGTLNASGGRILLTARAAANVADNVVNNSGMISATTAFLHNGEVILDAGDGTVEAGGTISASGRGAGESGGAITLAGNTVRVADNTTLDASGGQRGGTISIGGGLHGGGPYQAAQSTSVGSATIRADATTSGNGGTVSIWSTGHTVVAATVTARGGALSGNGGTVETSGHTLSVGSSAAVSTTAPNGNAGNWLLDPDYVVVDSGNEATPLVCGASCLLAYGDNPGNTSFISASTIQSALGGGTNVTLQARNDITVNAAISGVGTGRTLELDAGRSIILNADIDMSGNGGTLTLYAKNPSAPAPDSGAATISGTGVISADFVNLRLSANGADGNGIGSSGAFLKIGTGKVSTITNGANVYLQATSAAAGLVLGVFELGHGALKATSPGDLTIASGGFLASHASGDAIVLSAAHAFINNAGSNALILSDEDGRFLIYSASPGVDTFNGVNSGHTAIWNTTYPTGIAAAGSRYVFALQPTLTFTSTDLAKTYGDNLSGSLAAAFTAAGYQAAVAGAYLADNAASAYSGAPSVTSAGAAPGAAVSGSPYTMTIGQGSLASASGYAFNFASSGQLTIAPASLSVSANPQTKVYGGSDPAFSYVADGFVNNETAAILSGTLGRAAGEDVGSYGISVGSLSAGGNYTIAFSGNNLGITPATLSVMANHQTKVYGAVDPALSYVTTGLQFSDSAASVLTGALARQAGENVGNYAIGQGNLAANSNYTLAFTGNSLDITVATLTYVANSSSRTYGASNPVFGGAVTGFVNGDTQATATSGALAFGSAATAASNVGTYAITGSGLIANNGNYVFVQAAPNATALTINPATLTYVANPASRTFGTANPAFSGTVTGFVNAESLASATTGALAFISPATAASAAGSYAINGSGLSANNGNYVFVQAPNNATALTITPSQQPLLPDGHGSYLSWLFGRGGERPTDQDSLLFTFTSTDSAGGDFLASTSPGATNFPGADGATTSGPIADLTLGGNGYLGPLTSADQLSGSLSHYFSNGSLFEGDYSSWGNEALWY